MQTHPPEGTRLDVVVPPAAHAEAVRQWQILESNLSFCFRRDAVTRIRWDEPTLDLIPENDEEETLVNSWAIHVTRRYPSVPAMLPAAAFQVNRTGFVCGPIR